MAAEKRRGKRNNALALLLLPALVFLFFMGWSMYWSGDSKRPNRSKPKASKEDGVTILPAVFEETEQIIVK